MKKIIYRLAAFILSFALGLAIVNLWITVFPKRSSHVNRNHSCRVVCQDVGLSDANGKTAENLYNFLKSKGWQFGKGMPSGVRLFHSEEAFSSRYKAKDYEFGYFVIIRFKNLRDALAQFTKIDECYHHQYGHALMGKNFVIATFYSISCYNPTKAFRKAFFESQLTQKDYEKLQSDLNEFVGN
jgi:hypothetical protein